jgi:subtilisin family serine protease
VTRALLLSVLLAALGLTGAATTERPSPAAGGSKSQVVVLLGSPPLAVAGGERAARRVDEEHRRFEAALHDRIPDAKVRWRYRLVANGISVVLPSSELPRLELLPGVKRVYAPATYHVLAGPDAATIRARDLPAADLPNAGAGMKIGIIDDGVDQRHPFFDPTSYVMPPGFPKGQAAYTTAKVIVARAFPPPGTNWPHAAKPFDPEQSGHATHVAGIAAGNRDTLAQGARISGIAPRAYIGNYKALTVPTDADVGLDGNAPEIVAAIEAAVADGMDVINLSIGEPEIEPSRDVVALALDAAAAAGVVPVVAAGNDFDDFGLGSVASPGSAMRAITVGATTSGASPVIAGFSSAGPTTVSLRLKPDVVAPGSSILSSEPGGWRVSSGTSMAAPHVSGAVALLLQRHPDWTPEQVKAALSVTARSVTAGAGVARTTRAGAGLVDVAAADQPLVRPTPTTISFGLVGASAAPRATITLADGGGGAGPWSATVESLSAPTGTTATVPPEAVVPGALSLALQAGTVDGEISGVVVLRRDTITRRVPFWGRVAIPKLAAASRTLSRPGVYAGDTRGRPAQVDVYRYPEVPDSGPVSSRLEGPEQVFRIRVTGPIANFGVAITERGRGSRVEPRVVAAGDENRLTGYPALPVNLNPYVDEFGGPTLVAGAIKPRPGEYEIVFDSPTSADAGTFRFRLWINDVSPPTATITARTVRRGSPVVIRVRDVGSGVDPRSLEATVDGRSARATLRGGVVRIPTSSLAPGRHRVRIELAGHQETRNMENVARSRENTQDVGAGAPGGSSWS